MGDIDNFFPYAMVSYEVYEVVLACAEKLDHKNQIRCNSESIFGIFFRSLKKPRDE